MNIKQVITTLSVSMLMCCMARATTWYVAANGGSDSNDGKTEKTAFATIQKAYNATSSGDEIIVDDGTYSGFGGADKGDTPMTIRSRNGYTKTFVSGGLNLGYNNFYSHVAVVGITIGNAQGGISGGILKGCRITGMTTWSESELLNCHALYNCIVDNCSGYEFQASVQLSNCTLYNNSFVHFASAGYFLNCVMMKNAGSLDWSAGQYPSFSNCIQCECSWTTESTDPKLKDAANGDYRLLEGSPCIDAGDNSYASGDYDIGGNARIYNGTVDIGAYEWRPTIPAGIENITARQRYPWNGLVDLSFTVTGEPNETYDVSFIAMDVVGNTNLTMATLLDAKGSSVSVSDPVVPGTYRWIWNAAADLPDGFKCDRVTVAGAVEEHLGGVQLWENGPYWAECNVGATKPEESGYYFWWGDTVGYKRNSANDGWVSVKDGTAFTFEDGNCTTYGKDNSTLQTEGYIDSTCNLVSAHDAATAHLGAPWRMPTSTEIDALISNCTTTWTTRNGVYGRLITGKGAYVSKSLFLPAAAGYGLGSYLYNAGSGGYYWSSTPMSDSSGNACYLLLYSGYYERGSAGRWCGNSVRPVRALTK